MEWTAQHRHITVPLQQRPVRVIAAADGHAIEQEMDSCEHESIAYYLFRPGEGLYVWSSVVLSRPDDREAETKTHKGV